MIGISALELLFLVASGGGGLLGLPPGPRDAALMRCAPAESVVYVEWASRAEPKAGEPGVEGLLADPEVRLFLGTVKDAILKAADRASQNGPAEARVLAGELPQLVPMLLGRPGCLFVAPQPDAKGNGTLPFAALLASQTRGALVINGGDDADRIEKSALKLLALVPKLEPQPESLKEIKLPVPPDLPPVTIHREKSHFIVALGNGTLPFVLDGLNGSHDGLAKHATLKKALEASGISRVGSLSWIDLKGLQTVAVTLLGPSGAIVTQMSEMLGLSGVNSVVSVTGLERGQVVSKRFVATDGRTEGVLALVAGRGIRPEDFSVVPADADLVAAFSVDARKVLDAAKEIVRKSDPASSANLATLIQQLESVSGIKLEEGILQAFGDVWIVYDSPAAGGLLVTSLVGAIPVRDADRAKASYAKLVELVRNSLPGVTANGRRRRGATLEQAKFQDATIHYVNIIGDDVPFAPAFCLTPTHLLVAPHPQALKAHLRAAENKTKHFGSRLGTDFKTAEGDLLGFFYCDSKTAGRVLYSIAPYAGQVLVSQIQREGVEIDIFALPSAAGVLPYLGDSVSMVVRTKEGLWHESRAALPLPFGGLLMTLPAFVMHGF